MILKQRDIVAAALAGVAVVLGIYYFAIISPAVSKRETLVDHIAKKQGDLEQMLSLRQQWVEFKQARQEAEEILKRRGRDFTLLTYLEQVSRSVGIDKNLQYIKPLGFPEQDSPVQPMGIEMRFNGLNIKQLVDFLFKIEHSKNLLSIQRIKIQPVVNGTTRLLEVTLQVNTFALS